MPRKKRPAQHRDDCPIPLDDKHTECPPGTPPTNEVDRLRHRLEQVHAQVLEHELAAMGHVGAPTARVKNQRAGLVRERRELMLRLNARLVPNAGNGELTFAYETTPLDVVGAIAKRVLGLDTLHARNIDALDFHELGVSSIRAALLEAYNAGRDSD